MLPVDVVSESCLVHELLAALVAHEGEVGLAHVAPRHAQVLAVRGHGRERLVARRAVQLARVARLTRNQRILLCNLYFKLCIERKITRATV